MILAWSLPRSLRTEFGTKATDLINTSVSHKSLPGLTCASGSCRADGTFLPDYAEEGERKYLGGTFEVESMQDLERAATLPGAGEIEELKDAPGGGYLITLTDPGGFIFNLMYGQTPAEVETDKLPSKLVVNSETEKPRKRQFQRFQPGPAAVHKVRSFLTLLQRCRRRLTYLLAWTLWPLCYQFPCTG